MHEISKKQFLANFYEKTAHQRVPFRAMLELTYGCNLRCVHCLNPTHTAKDELRTKELFRLIDQLLEQGTFDLCFTGGEIFTRRDCFEILEYAKNKGFYITIFTNATMITPQMADRIQVLKPRNVEISIYGATRETYERVTRIPGSFRRFLRGVQVLRSRRVPLIIKMPVVTLNQQEVEQARALVEGWGIKFVYCTDIHPRQDGSQEPLRYRLPPKDVVQVHQQMLGYKEWSAEGGGPKEEACQAHQQMFTCSCGRNKLAVNPYGKMNLCVAFPIPQYDIQTGSVADGWRSLVELVDDANARPSETYECPSCRLQKHCQQGPVNAWLETGDLAPCLPYFKELAALEKQAREAASRNEHQISRQAGGSEESGSQPCVVRSSPRGSPRH